MVPSLLRPGGPKSTSVRVCVISRVTHTEQSSLTRLSPKKTPKKSSAQEQESGRMYLRGGSPKAPLG